MDVPRVQYALRSTCGAGWVAQPACIFAVLGKRVYEAKIEAHALQWQDLMLGIAALQGVCKLQGKL